jgi:hypothetical protein
MKALNGWGSSPKTVKLEALEIDFLRKAVDHPKLIKNTDKDWLTHVKPILASVRPNIELNRNTRISMLELFDFLSTDRSLDGGYTTEHVRLIYKILAEHNRSDYVASQSKDTQYSSAVPTAMAAYRDKYGIKYSSWIHDAPWMAIALLGKSLSEINITRDYLESLNESVTRTYDSEIGDSEYEDSLGISSSRHEPIDVFDFDYRVDLKLNATRDGTILDTGYATIKRVFTSEHPLGSQHVPKFYWHMLTQTWIFSPSVRHKDMITNMQDFDAVDPSLTPMTLLKDPKPTLSSGW